MLHTKVLTKHDGKVRLSARWIESIEEMYHRVEQQKDRDEISSMFCGDEKVFTAKTFHELNAIRHDVSAQLLS